MRQKESRRVVQKNGLTIYQRSQVEQPTAFCNQYEGLDFF